MPRIQSPKFISFELKQISLSVRIYWGLGVVSNISSSLLSMAILVFCLSGMSVKSRGSDSIDINSYTENTHKVNHPHRQFTTQQLPLNYNTLGKT